MAIPYNVTDLSALDYIVGTGFSNAFGNFFVPIIAVLIFLAFGVALHAGFEVMAVFIFTLVILLSIYTQIPSIIFLGFVMLGVIIIYLAMKRLWGF